MDCQSRGIGNLFFCCLMRKLFCYEKKVSANKEN